jgi:hypothetical protein
MARPHGTKNIESPEKMWEHFEAYRNLTKSKPILVQDYVGKDGMEVRREKERPLSVDGFECYCFENGIMSDLGHYFSNHEQRYSDYVTICSHIRKVVRNDQIQGGMAGIYNPSITQRLNGLTEKVQTDTNININKLPEWLTNDIQS